MTLAPAKEVGLSVGPESQAAPPGVTLRTAMSMAGLYVMRLTLPLTLYLDMVRLTAARLDRARQQSPCVSS